MAVIQSTYNRLSKEGFKVIITGDLNGDSRRHLYVQDVILSSWLFDNHKSELTRLYTQPIPLTFLGSMGQTSFIDHFIVDSRDNWSIIEQVNILSSESEYLQLKVSADHENDIKGIFPWI